MFKHFKFGTLAMAALALAVLSCSDDGGPGDGSTDTTPPAVTSVTAPDAGHIAVKFSESVQRASAENLPFYTIIESTPGYAPASPGDTLHLASASLMSDLRTVLLTTISLMDTIAYDFSVKGVKDLAGNSILTPITKTFTGSNDPDLTPPALVARSPAPNAVNVPVGTQITMQFSEAVTAASFFMGFSCVSEAGPLEFLADSPDNGVHVIVYPQNLLSPGVKYNVKLEGIQDYSGNTMPTVTWSFTTTSTVDITPPALVSTIPADGATRVSIHTTLSMTFSEAINQTEIYIDVYPEIGDGEVVFTNSGKTLTFTPDIPLAADQQYIVTLAPGAVMDLAGNENTVPYVIRFTTGEALATGHIAGTITGDPLSDSASDPTGAYVVAATASPMETDNFKFGAIDVVAGNNTYNLSSLVDDTYYPFAIMDSNKDGVVDPSQGDAIGMWGVDIRAGDMSPDSVTIAGGNHVANVNFPLFDPSAVTGHVTYSGIYSMGDIRIGLFDADAFDPTGPPLYGTMVFWPAYSHWEFNTLDGIADGRYYVAAYMDVNYNSMYDPGVDPAAVYGGTTPTLVWVQKGHDFNNIYLTLLDPAPPSPTANASPGVKWPVNQKNERPGFERMRSIMEGRIR